MGVREEGKKGGREGRWEEERVAPACAGWKMGNPSQALGKAPALNGDHPPHTRYHQSFWLRIHLNGDIFKIFPSHIFLPLWIMCPRNQKFHFGVSLRPTSASEMWPPRSWLERIQEDTNHPHSAMPHPLGDVSTLVLPGLLQRGNLTTNHPQGGYGSFPTSQLFTLGGQGIGASASASVLPVHIQG